MTNADKKLGYDSGDKTTVARIKTFASQNGALIGLIILCIALSIVAPAFLSASNLMNVGIQAATVAILAFGQTFVIVAAGIDHCRSAGRCSIRRLIRYDECVPEVTFLYRYTGHDVRGSRLDLGHL